MGLIHGLIYYSKMMNSQIFRIDFDQFTLMGPEPVNHMCNSDQFIVSGGNPVPGICGVNNGNHSEYKGSS